jgi:putative transposase
MPRLPRLHVPNGFYHAVLRGNHREALFDAVADRLVLNDIVADVINRFGARVHAFCWMSNHLHTLLQIADRPLGEIMQRVAMRYARHRHKILRTTGHLFERRYRAKLVDTDAYFLELLRYIHLNPVAAGIVTDPALYAWSSHKLYLGIETLSVPWVTTEFGLSLFSADDQQARLSYAKFVRDPNTGADHSPKSEHGATIDMTGQKKSALPGKLVTPPYRPHRSVHLSALRELGERVCLEHHVSLDRLCSLSRARNLTPVRLDFISQAIDLRIATLADLARFLHRDPSALSQLLERHGRSRQTLS